MVKIHLRAITPQGKFAGFISSEVTETVAKQEILKMQEAGGRLTSLIITEPEGEYAGSEVMLSGLLLQNSVLVFSTR